MKTQKPPLDSVFAALHTNKGAWCSRFVQRHLTAQGWPAATMQALYPQGMASVIKALHLELAEQAIATTILFGSQSTQIRQLLAARMALLTPHTENLRLCYRTGALSPWRLVNVCGAYQVASMFWQAVGDVATDGNAYTKRALLAKIIWQADLVWLGDASPNFADTLEFIDRSLANTKIQGQKWGHLLQPLLRHISY